MKKLFIILVLCLSMLLAVTALGHENEPPETVYEHYPHDYYLYEHYPYYPYYPQEYSGLAYTPPEEFEHFATATIEELYAYSMDGGMYFEAPAPEEIPCFDPPPAAPIIAPPRYTSAAVVVMDADTGIVLYGSGHHAQLYPASITKIMTALIVLEHVQDLSERIEFSHNAVFSIPRTSSHIAMDVGETLTVYQALYGLMLSSANEVSIALA